MIYRTLIVSLLFLLSCKDFSTIPQEAVPVLSKADTLRESVFRYQFNHNHSGQQQTAKVYFLSVMTLPDSTTIWRNADPTDQLLVLFVSNAPPVRPFSRASVSMEGVFDRETGERGLLFQLRDIRWIGDDQAEIAGGYYEADLSSSGNTYYLERRNGLWIVTKDVLHFIS